MLLRREDVAVPDAVRRIVAIQAQEPASPYLALWNRIADLDPADLDLAFAEQIVVKASLMRLTLHAVHAQDHPGFHHAMSPSLRASRLYDKRFTGLGLSPDDADAALADAVRFAKQARTNAEFEAMLTERVGELPRPGLWWALRTFAPLVHAPTDATWSFGPRLSYVAPHARIRPEDHGASVRTLVRRYLEGFGPASVADVAQFTLLRRPVVRDALSALDDELEKLESDDGTELFDLPDAPRPDENTPAPSRLMAMWDSTLLAYADRSRIIPPGYRSLVIRTNGDVLPTVLVHGHVVGVWRAVDTGIEITAFERLSPAVWTELESEAAALRGFLTDRDPLVYRRCAHWWASLAEATTTVRVIT